MFNKTSEHLIIGVIIQIIFNAYNDYKKSDIQSCESKLKSIGLCTAQSSGKIIPEHIHIDPHAFHDTISFKWVFFRSVDLGYVRKGNGFITIKADNSYELVIWINNEIQGTG